MTINTHTCDSISTDRLLGTDQQLACTVQN